MATRTRPSRLKPTTNPPRIDLALSELDELNLSGAG
jgi:hypothetical protein